GLERARQIVQQERHGPVERTEIGVQVPALVVDRDHLDADLLLEQRRHVLHVRAELAARILRAVLGDVGGEVDAPELEGRDRVYRWGTDDRLATGIRIEARVLTQLRGRRAPGELEVETPDGQRLRGQVQGERQASDGDAAQVGRGRGRGLDQIARGPARAPGTERQARVPELHQLEGLEVRTRRVHRAHAVHDRETP